MKASRLVKDSLLSFGRGRSQSVIVCLWVLLAQMTFATEPLQIAQWLEQSESLRLTGHYADAAESAQLALTSARSLRQQPLEAEAHYQRGLSLYHQELFPDARSHFEVGLTLSRLNDLDALEADFLAACGVIDWKTGRLQDAISHLRNALKIRKALQDWTSMASVANNLGIIQYSLKNHLEAVHYFRTGLEWQARGRESPRMVSSLSSNLAEALIHLGELEEAEPLLYQSMQLEEELGDPYNMAFTLFNFGELRSRQKRPEEAMDYYQQALNIQQELGIQLATSLTRLRIGEKLFDLGDIDQAVEVLELGYLEAKEHNARTLLRDHAELLAKAHSREGSLSMSEFYAQLQRWLENEINPPAVSILQNNRIYQTSDSGDEALRRSTANTLLLVFSGVLAALLLIFTCTQYLRLYGPSSSRNAP